MTTTHSALQRRIVNIQSLALPVLEGGPQHHDEAIVFVHGNPGSGQDWAHLASEAASFARVLAPDMPGFGQASKPANFNYTVEGYASCLGALMHACGIQRVHLVMHDFGGPWGLAWAAMNPERVLSVTLINTGVLRGYQWHYMARIWRTPLLGELSMALMTRASFGLAMKHGNPRGLPTEFVDRMYGDLDAGTKRAVLKLYRATQPAGPQSEMLHETLRHSNRPALVVWGACDPYIPLRFAHLQQETFPLAQVEVLKQSGHFPFADDPQGVAAAVIPFLRRQYRAEMLRVC